MPSDLFKVGLIIPSSNTVMESDFHRRLGTKCVISSDRMYLSAVNREGEEEMIEGELTRAARLIKTTAPHLVVFGCTSAGSLGGLDHDAAIGRRIEKETGARAVTVVRSVIEQLQRIGPRRVAVFTPYNEELTRTVSQCVVQAGFQLVKTAGMGIIENLDIGRVTPVEIREFVETHMKGVDADCVFLSCTNWQAVDALSSVKTRFGVPVISSNQATIDAVESLLSEETIRS